MPTPDWTREIAARFGVQVDSGDDQPLIQELADHLQDRYEGMKRNGATEEEAVAAALAELDSVEVPVRDAWRDARRPAPPEPIPVGGRSSGNLFADLWRDLRYGARMLRRTPGFTLVAIFTLALGIGANTTVFTVINTILLNPLPVARPAELLTVLTTRLEGTRPDGAGAEGAEASQPISHPNLVDLQQHNDVFSSLAGYSAPMVLTWLNGDAPERLFGELVTANYFDTLGLRPVKGRFFLSEEDRTPNTHAVVVLGYGTWQQRFGGAPDIIGRIISINRVPFTVIGIAPEGFKGIGGIFGPDLWMPAMMTGQVVSTQQRTWLRDRAALAFRGVGRLKPGVTPAQATASLRALAATLARDYPDANRGRGLGTEPLTRMAMMTSGQPATIFAFALLMGVVGLILLIACSNVANLLLARNASRRQEVALRLALGAGRGRLVRQLLTESVLLAMVSGLVGLVVTLVGSQVLWSFRPADVAANLVDLAIDRNVLGFGLIVSAMTGVIFGAMPAWQASRGSLVDALKEEARLAGRTRRRVSLGRVLLVGQVALSLVSLIVAGLCLRAVQRAYAIDPGFESQRLGILMINPGQAGYTRAQSEQFFRDARARVAAIPGVTAVSWATNLPMFARPSRAVTIEGQETRNESRGEMTVVNTIDLDFLPTVGIPLTRGRDFTAADRDGALPVAIVNETMAARYWPNQDPIGKRVRFTGEDVTRQVVGVARTANYASVGETPQLCVYLPLAQNFTEGVVLYVRTAAADPSPVLGTVQREIRSLDPQIQARDARTIGRVLAQAMFGATIGAGMLSVFGLLALGLASLGLYGVMACSVSARRREIGVRMALGANHAGVMRLVLREGMTLVGFGIITGLVASLLVGSAISRMLYGISPFDPLSAGIASVALCLAAALACYLPARRASRLDPLVALRDGQ
jgi:predicted permease